MKIHASGFLLDFGNGSKQNCNVQQQGIYIKHSVFVSSSERLKSLMPNKMTQNAI